jgi:predicted TIM-barrel fold metal-dependent hydrolase
VIDQTAPSAAETLSRLVREHGVRRIQLTSMDMPHGVLWDPRTFPVWERAAEAGIPVTSRPGSRIGYVHGTSAVLGALSPLCGHPRKCSIPTQEDKRLATIVAALLRLSASPGSQN